MICETKDIKNQYNQIAKSFSKTRYKKWDCVINFLKDIKTSDKVLELGCGNGKNIYDIKDQALGVDICPELCNICKEKGITVIESDILNFNIDQKFDYILCIAVIHHLNKQDDRIKLIRKIKSLLKENGKAIITCWNTNETRYTFTPGDNLVKFGQINRYYYIFKPNELYELCKNELNVINNYEECFNDIVIVQ